MIAAPQREVARGDFRVEVKDGVVVVPGVLHNLAAEHSVATEEDLVEFTRSHPRCVATTFGWSYDEAVLAAEALIDDLRPLLSAAFVRTLTRLPDKIRAFGTNHIAPNARWPDRSSAQP